MPLEPTDLRLFTAAHGYLELGMFLDAEAELDAIDPSVRRVPDVMAVRMEIYSRQKDWERMRGIAERLTRIDPNDPGWVVSYAFATRRAESLQAARGILLAAIERHPREPVIPYNLACYECQLGNLKSATRYLEHAIKMKPGMRAMALDDPDLEPLWDSLATGMVPK